MLFRDMDVITKKEVKMAESRWFWEAGNDDGKSDQRFYNNLIKHSWSLKYV